jgi:hypothetical protein
VTFWLGFILGVGAALTCVNALLLVREHRARQAALRPPAQLRDTPVALAPLKGGWWVVTFASGYKDRVLAVPGEYDIGFKAFVFADGATWDPWGTTTGFPLQELLEKAKAVAARREIADTLLAESPPPPLPGAGRLSMTQPP